MIKPEKEIQYCNHCNRMVKTHSIYKMKILIACEESQSVCRAFRARGHEAYSCDILPCSGGHPEWHIKQNVLSVIKGGNFPLENGDNHIWIDSWDMMIAHPPCTHLAVSGARWFKDKQKEQKEALEFIRKLLDAPIPRIALENPISIISSRIRKPDQIIQPWQFGHGETKATCLWLKELPLLQPTDIVEGRENRIHKMPPSKDRGKLRSKTYQGIADAIAEQWGAFV